MAHMRMEDRDGAPRERLPLDGAIEIVQALPPTAHARAQHDRGVLVEGRADHGRHGQDNMPRDATLMEDLTDLVDPVIGIDFGAPQAQRCLATHGSQVRALTPVQATVFAIADLLWIATRQPLRHQGIIVPRLRARMARSKRVPVLGKDLFEDTPVPRGCCQHLRPPREGLGIVAVPQLYHDNARTELEVLFSDSPSLRRQIAASLPTELYAGAQTGLRGNQSPVDHLSRAVSLAGRTTTGRGVFPRLNSVASC